MSEFAGQYCVITIRTTGQGIHSVTRNLLSTYPEPGCVLSADDSQGSKLSYILCQQTSVI